MILIILNFLNVICVSVDVYIVLRFYFFRCEIYFFIICRLLNIDKSKKNYERKNKLIKILIFEYSLRDFLKIIILFIRVRIC